MIIKHDGYHDGKDEALSGHRLGAVLQANVDMIERIRERVTRLLKQSGKIQATTADGVAILPGMRLWTIHDEPDTQAHGVFEATWPLDPKRVYYKSKRIATINFAVMLLKGVK